MLRHASPAGLFAFAMVLAGCFGASPNAAVADEPAAPAGPPQTDATTGAIEGTALDDEGRPVPGVTVGILELDQTTETGPDGRYVFNHVAPGFYTVAYHALGYEGGVRGVTVAAASVALVDLPLVPIIVHVAYHESWQDQGYFDCSWSTPRGTGPCFFGVYTLDWPNSKRAWNYPTKPGTMTAINEMTWTKGTAATGDTLRVTFSYANRTTSHWYCDAESTNPVQMRWDREAGCVSGGDALPDDEPDTIPLEGQELRTFVNTGRANPPLGTVFGLAYQQNFQFWASLFYWEPAAEGYTALSDG